MVILIDNPPDRISRSSAFTTFTWGDIRAIGSEITTVFSPIVHEDWKVIRFKVLAGDYGSPLYQPIAERELTPAEIAHFEALRRED